MPKLQLCKPDLENLVWSAKIGVAFNSMVQRACNTKTLEDSSNAANEARNALALANTLSQRMEDLAREYDCLGYFDSDDDGPKAA